MLIKPKSTKKKAVKVVDLPPSEQTIHGYRLKVTQFQALHPQTGKQEYLTLNSQHENGNPVLVTSPKDDVQVYADKFGLTFGDGVVLDENHTAYEVIDQD